MFYQKLARLSFGIAAFGILAFAKLASKWQFLKIQEHKMKFDKSKYVEIQKNSSLVPLRNWVLAGEAF
jgi:hypothetical protein